MNLLNSNFDASCFDNMPTLNGEVVISSQKYIIVGVVGKGSSKTVFEGRHKDNILDRIAVLFWNKIESDKDLEKVEQEGRVLQNISGLPGVLQLIESPKRVGFKGMLAATQFCGEGTLNTWAKGQTVLSRLKMFFQILTTIQILHEKKIAHGDLKPQNIGIDNQTPVILDWGSSTDQGDIPCKFAGTLNYAFSQCESNTPIQRDIFALGVILFELMCSHVENGTMYRTVQSLTGREIRSRDGFFATQEELNNAFSPLPQELQELLKGMVNINSDRDLILQKL